MTNWTMDDLRRLDLKYAKQGVPLHQRPFRAATDLLGPTLVMMAGTETQADKIMKAYAEMIPEANSTWPGMGIGLAASVDQVRKVTFPVAIGAPEPLHVWRGLGFKDEAEWWAWCREDRNIAAETSFALADLYDFTYGVDDIKGAKPEAETLWQMAASNLGDTANSLPTLAGVDSVIQSICLVAELSIKAALVANGADPKSFKGPDGHDLAKLAVRMEGEIPHRHDPLVQTVIDRLPPYVASRYKPAGLTRLEVVRLALGVQFLAAATVRRFSKRDLAAQMESGDWPAPRPALFA